MMTSVSGVRGIGKTYHLSKEVYEHYKQNFLCITNFSHVYAHISVARKKDYLFEIIREVGAFKKMGYELCDLLPTFKHTGVFMAIDEGHLYFGADEWKRYGSDPKFKFVIEFLSQCRKQDVEIWYSAQDPAKIDKNWRRYTEDWVRYRPVFNIRKKILVPHPTRPILRAEVRYLIPLIWEEHHDLDASHPEFNTNYHEDEEGFMSASKGVTLQWRKIRLSGWMDPFPYKLYDSHEMLGLESDVAGEKFELLKSVSYIPHNMKRERFPTIKSLLGMQSTESAPPVRIKFKDILLPSPESMIDSNNIMQQPEEFLEDISAFNKEKISAARKHPHESKKEAVDFAKWEDGLQLGTNAKH